MKRILSAGGTPHIEPHAENIGMLTVVFLGRRICDKTVSLTHTAEAPGSKCHFTVQLFTSRAGGALWHGRVFYLWFSVVLAGASSYQSGPQAVLVQAG